MKNDFSIIPFRQLAEIALNQLDKKGSYFNIPREVFFKPRYDDPFRMKRFGQWIETPLGTAAGPHTQMSQNIITAWLCGARYIELKTIQTKDQIKVSKPCIDLQDEGYNCEWSQELSIRDSFDQYLNAWILLHVLKDKLGHASKYNPGTIFNMSIGYDHKGIMQDNVQWFLDRMMDCTFQKAAKLKEIKDIYPQIERLNIPDCISDNVTLSTMHGCPPEEIEKIGLYLIRERKLHTVIKLNPTLLGRDKVNGILKKSGFNIIVPDEAFEHDLKYSDAINIIKNLHTAARESDVYFGLKLTNTLECQNNKEVFSESEKTMYMSGRSLHPIAINLAAKLQNDFDGQLNISFSAGVNVFNFPKVISCGLSPVTVCTDLLKPGGYGLLNQYLANLSGIMERDNLKSIEDYILKTSDKSDACKGTLHNLENYAGEVLADENYKEKAFNKPDIKTERILEEFDCIAAPCVNACPAHQDIPEYMYFTSQGDINKAFAAIFRTNPFPNTTGMICDHLCETKCTRINYDDPLLIREIKRVVAENHQGNFSPERKPLKGKKVAIVGAGPSGLSCAYYLTLAGFQTDVFESKHVSGGMVLEVIPPFRIKEPGLKKDLEKIEISGVKVFYGITIDRNRFSQLRKDYHYIYISTGAWSTRKFAIEGIDSIGVLDPIRFLSDVKNGKFPVTGKNIAVIGGGNTAMDVARTALRLAGKNGKVTILYRRTMALMPADPEEIKAVMDEGIEVLDLTLPVKVNTENDKVTSLTCIKLRLDAKTEGKRPMPVEMAGSEFVLTFDTVIPAIGQDAKLDFIEEVDIKAGNNIYQTKMKNVFIGGDAMRGGSTLINAISDGRNTAMLILRQEPSGPVPFKKERESGSFTSLMIKRMIRRRAVALPVLPVDQRDNFDLVTRTLSQKSARDEASRCLLCDELCNICVTVCPNLACYSYRVKPVKTVLKKIEPVHGVPSVKTGKPFEVNQQYQILHIADWCNQCGNCSTFCPATGAPFSEKPHLYLTRKSFDETDTGYYFEPANQHLYYKNHNSECSIRKNNSRFYYTESQISIEFEEGTFNIFKFDMGKKKKFEMETAAQMSLILAGSKEFWTGEIE